MIIPMDEQRLNDVERKVIRLVTRIKNNRNRACFQNILSVANREEIKMELDELKETIDKLVNRGIMRDEGKAGKESFFVLKDVLNDNYIPETQEIINNSDETDYVGEGIIPETQDLTTCEENCDAEIAD